VLRAPCIPSMPSDSGCAFGNMARWMPETRPTGAPRTRLVTSYKTLFGSGAFNCYLLMLVGGLAGIAVFEACSGVLLGAGLGLSSMPGGHFKGVHF
jgi:hypothetical protein